MWKVLPTTNRQGIKNFIIAFIIKTASEEVSLERNKILLGKLNMVLVQVSRFAVICRPVDYSAIVPFQVPPFFLY